MLRNPAMPRLVPLLALLSLGFLACERKAPSPAPTEQGPILIGSIGSLTGSEASFGSSVRDGIQFAVEEVNAAGGVKGRRVELRAYDSQGRVEQSVSAVQRLLSKDRALVIIGDDNSSATLAIAGMAQAAQIPLVAPSSTHPDVTRKGDYIFRTCFIDPFQGQAMASFARDTLKLERVSILKDVKNAYSLGLAESFTQSFTRLGGTIVSVESYAKGDTDFRAALLAVKKVKPQALYLPGFYTEVGLIARQAREVGLAQPLLGGDGWESDQLFELAGSAVDGSYYSAHYAVDNPSPEMKRFAGPYQARYGRAPDVSVVLGYDAARVVLAAMQRASSLTGPALRDEIAKTKDFPAVSGTITLDAERNPVKPAIILKLQGGKREFVTAVTP